MKRITDTGENGAYELLEKIAPKVFRNKKLLNDAVIELRKMYDRKPFAGTEKMTFTQFIRAYAEYAMTA